VRELVQDAFTPAALAAEAVELLGGRGEEVRAGLVTVRTALGPVGASERAAWAVAAVAGEAT